jgi:transcriptional regulator with XRE-family HTH domain
MLRSRKDHNWCANIIAMAVNNGSSPATHFGRQMRKERLARGWSLREFSARTGINIGSASQIENGKRPPTEAVAARCDEAFPERKGWFAEYYEESKSWLPPGLRSWAEHEDKAVRLEVWSPGIVHGLFQTEDYARVFIAALPGVTADVVSARLASRMERQRRVLMREDPPQASYVVDHTALYRCVGSAEIMAGQMDRLAEMASMPNVTMQVLPAVAHPATASELIIADNNAAYAEHLAAGGVYTEDETVTRLERIFATIRGESYRVSESVAIIRRAGEAWTAGASPDTAGLTGPA